MAGLVDASLERAHIATGAHRHAAPERRRRRGAHGLLLLRVAALAAAVQGAVAFVVAPLQGHFAGDFEDFSAYLEAGRAVARGGDVYAHVTHAAPTVALSGFIYPPLVAWLCRPLAALPLHTAETLWLWLCVACTVAGTAVVVRTLLPASWPRLEIVAVVSLLYSPATYNYWHGQMNPLVFLLLALALREWVAGRQTRCGIIIGIAASIKLAPAVLVVLLLRRRWWRGAAAAAVTGAGTAASAAVLLGWTATSEFVRDVLPVLGRDDGWLYNQSWNGTVNRAVGHAVLTVQPNIAWVGGLSLMLGAAGLALSAWAVRPGVRPREIRGAEFGAGVAAMLLAGTITWYAHYVHLLIPLAAAAALLVHRRGSRPLAGALGFAVLTTAVLAPMLIAAASMTRITAASHTAWWWPLMQVCSLPALAAAALLVALSRAPRPPVAARPAA